MSFKQWQAIITLGVSASVVIWLIWDTSPGASGASVSEVAMRLVWAIVAMIVLNIVVSIAFVIVASIASGEAWKDEKSDERDRAVNAKSMRNAYFAASVGGALTLLVLALGYDPTFAARFLFAALIAAGAIEAVSKLVYYRIG